MGKSKNSTFFFFKSVKSKNQGKRRRNKEKEGLPGVPPLRRLKKCFFCSKFYKKPCSNLQEARSLGSFFLLFFLFFFDEEEPRGMTPYLSMTDWMKASSSSSFAFWSRPQHQSTLLQALAKPVKEKAPRSAARCGHSSTTRQPQQEVLAALPVEAPSVPTNIHNLSLHLSRPLHHRRRAVHCGGEPSPAPTSPRVPRASEMRGAGDLFGALQHHFQ